MKKVEINGNDYFFKVTISAAKKFKNKFKCDVTVMSVSDVEHVQYLIYYGLEAGCKIEGVKFDLTVESFDDYSIVELTELFIKSMGEGKKDPK